MTEDGGAAITALRSELLLQLGEMRGDIRLILQSIEHQSVRAEEHRQSITTLDARVDVVERTAATRTELDAAVEQARKEARKAVADLRTELETEKRERRADRRVYIAAILSLLVAVIAAGIAVALGWK